MIPTRTEITPYSMPKAYWQRVTSLAESFAFAGSWWLICRAVLRWRVMSAPVCMDAIFSENRLRYAGGVIPLPYIWTGLTGGCSVCDLELQVSILPGRDVSRPYRICRDSGAVCGTLQGSWEFAEKHPEQSVPGVILYLCLNLADLFPEGEKIVEGFRALAHIPQEG